MASPQLCPPGKVSGFVRIPRDILNNLQMLLAMSSLIKPVALTNKKMHYSNRNDKENINNNVLHFHIYWYIGDKATKN